MKSYEQQIHEASMRILKRTGMRFEHPEAQRVLRENGVDVDADGVARFEEKQLMYWVNQAPHAFTLYARNPEHDITVGGDHLNPAPGYGCPSVVERDGTVRSATMKDFVKFAKLYHQQKTFDVNGGIIVQPDDLPVEHATLLMFYMTYLNTDKVLLTGTADDEQMVAMIEMAKAAFGGAENLRKYPRMITLINTVTPLLLTNVMTDSLMEFVKYRQPVIIGSLGQAGTTSPMTLAGSIAVSNAEILAGIALCQMLSPGTPVVYGCETTTADMRSGATAIGAPEGALCYQQAGRMADYYGIPSRGGGCLTDAKKVDAQAGYEAMMTYMVCRNANINFMIHAAGIMDSYASMSYEKLIMDFEVIDYVNRYYRGFEINAETIPEDVIDAVGHGGVYLSEDHTLKHCRTEALTPAISVRGPTEDPAGKLEQNIQQRIETMLEEYQRPPLDEQIVEQMRQILRGRGVPQSLIDEIEAL